MTSSKSKIIYHYALTFSAFVFCLTSCLTPPDNTGLIKISNNWAPYRTYACLYFWHWKDNAPVKTEK